MSALTNFKRHFKREGVAMMLVIAGPLLVGVLGIVVFGLIRGLFK